MEYKKETVLMGTVKKGNLPFANVIEHFQRHGFDTTGTAPAALDLDMVHGPGNTDRLINW